MLIVLADDFSGAAEIGGIGYRYGLNAEVQLKFDASSTADLIVLDADTRSLTKAGAINKTENLVKDLISSGKQIQLFKKVDSVFRGHIVAEINVLQQYFNYKRVLLLPANPARGRKIISGEYFVNDLSLNKTVFVNDPHFPALSSYVEKIIATASSALPHIHLTQGIKLPDSGLITGDVTCKEDIANYLANSDNGDLCCGAAECFEAFLENKGYVVMNKSPDKTVLQWPYFSLIISGSTVKDQFENRKIKKLTLQPISLPGQWNGNQFILEKNKAEEWHEEISKLLLQHKIAAIHIDHEVKPVNKATEIFSNYFIRLMRYISEKQGRANIHFALTGGATASVIIRSEGINTLKVEKEIAPGVVTLINQKTKGLFTVKPGSYLWPAFFIESLVNQNKSSE